MSSPASAATLSGTVHQGNTAYEKQDYQTAVEKYQKALNKDTESDIIHFNAGAAEYKLGNYEKSTEHLQKALLTEDPQLRKDAHYGLGNAFYRLAEQKGPQDPQAAVPLLEKSLAQYEQALQIVPEDEDTKYNHEFVTRVLEKVKKQLEKQKQQCQNPQNKKGGGQKKQEGSAGKSQGQQKQEEGSGKKDQGQEQEKKDDGSGMKDQGEGEENEEKGQKKKDEGQEKKDQGQENKDNGQQDKDDGSGMKDGGQEKQEAGEEQGANGQAEGKDLSRREAEMMLKDYENNEEPKGLLNLNGKFDTRPVLKDW